MDDLKKIRKRIRDLTQMTTDNGCTEAEAMAAAEKAMELMQRYGLNSEDLDRESASLGAYGKRRTVVDGLWQEVAKICRCHTYGVSDNGLRIVYYGRPADVAIAEYLHDILRVAVHRASAEFKETHEYQKRRKRATRNAAIKAFQSAMCGRLRARLNELWWNRHKATVDYAESIANEHKHRDLLFSELQAKMKFVTPKSLKLPDRRFDGARYDGFRAGDRVSLNPATTGSGPVAALTSS
jgi:hypothetical protein